MSDHFLHYLSEMGEGNNSFMIFQLQAVTPIQRNHSSEIGYRHDNLY